MAIDFSVDLDAILGFEASPVSNDIPGTTGTYAQDATSDTAVYGILYLRRATPGQREFGETGTQEEATLIVQDDQFTNVTVPAVMDTYTISGQAAWRVMSVGVRAGGYYVFGLARAIQQGTT